MLLLSGPPGCGKTHAVLEQLRSALQVDEAGVRLIVPAEPDAVRLRTRLALEGLVFRPRLVTTLDRFLSEWTDVLPLRPFELELIVTRVLSRDVGAPFTSVASAAGFRRLISRLVNEFAAVGFDSVELSRAAAPELQQGSLESAFLRVFEEIEKEIARGRAVLAPTRIARAAEEILRRGAGALRTLFFDGFQTFNDSELALLHAVSEHADVTVTLPAWDGAAPARAALHAMGALETELQSSLHRFPVRHVLRASSVAEEVAEIALRIREQVASGRPFGDMAVLVRSRDPYVPALEAAFDRHGIPARSGFARPLAAHPAVRYLCGLVESMLEGWPHQRLTALLAQPISGFGGTPPSDRFDFAVRERPPGAGLESLRGLSDAPRLGALLDRLEALESWRASLGLPSEWAFRLRSLRSLTQAPAVSDGVSHSAKLVWRSTAHALDAFCGAASEAAATMPPQPVRFGVFWDMFVRVLNRNPFEIPDRRANVVEVLDVEDAGGLAWPVVFVPGLAQGWFPRSARPEPLFDDALRCRLQVAGIPIGAAALRRSHEEFLFEVACTRASSEVTFSWPERNEYGLPVLPSTLLDAIGVETARPHPPQLEPVEPERHRPAHLHDADVLDALCASFDSLTPAAIETFLECPYRFFLLSTLELERAPGSSVQRLGRTVQVDVVRQALSAPHADFASLESAFEDAFSQACAAQGVAPGPEVESLRAHLLRAARRLASNEARLGPARGGGDGETARVLFNEEIECELSEDVSITGRIDRYDIDAAGRAHVFGYRYAPPGLNGPVEESLYLAALQQNFGHRPGSVTCLSVVPSPQPGSATHAATDLQEVRRAAIAAFREIRRGCVEPRIRSSSCCTGCEFPDVCRMGSAVAPEGGSVL